MAGQEFSLQVTARLPDKIARLHDLAGNLWFSWNRAARGLFRSLDPQLWQHVGRNPKVFLRCVDQSVVNLAAENDRFLGEYRKVLAEFDAYREEGVAAYRPAQIGKEDLIAYFCAEYGFHDSVPIYSGGLGILAGDHCKTASDLHLPFVAVGLLYRQGYFIQTIDEGGRQLVEYRYTPAEDIPVYTARDSQGQDVIIRLRFPGRDVAVKIWRADVGRVPVLLLDTDVPGNDEDDRRITQSLYGGDQTTRIKQEFVLGVGGVRALRALGFQPAVWHINEGHPAFQIIERARELVATGLPFDAALETLAAATVFTTHTPVAAGHDVFPPELVVEHFEPMLAELGITPARLLALGRQSDDDSRFNMTRLAVAGARSVNGVSRIHGGISQQILAAAWPEIPPRENPVGYVTNAVHVPTFMRQEWAELLEQQLGTSWRVQLTDRELTENILDIPDGRFWYVKQRVKSEMLTALRNRLTRQHQRNRVSEAHIHRMLKYIDPENPDVLTIGFARRFATYKRATLLFSDLNWLRDIVDRDERPVVFIFAGKAHPADEPGQRLMQEVHRVANLPEFFGRILLVEGYDIDLGNLLTSGVDVWLNNPIYPMEASGTSGIKAAINGSVNLSVLDGWWAEGYNAKIDGANGWAIPPSAIPDDGERDRQDARTLYEILQDDVIPLYYQRDQKLEYAPKWVQLCKRSMATVLPFFNSNRFMNDYACCFYGPAARHAKRVAADNHAAASDLAAWKKRVRAAWPDVRLSMRGKPENHIGFEQGLTLEIEAQLNGLSPEDVRVECVVHRDLTSELTVPVPRFAEHGRTQESTRYIGGEAIHVGQFTAAGGTGAAGVWRYQLELRAPWCGALRYEIRVLPRHPQLSHPHEMGLMRWL
jgi:starch phosphorylase